MAKLSTMTTLARLHCNTKKMYQPISPLDISMYILLRDALEDLAIDVEVKRLNLDTTMKISGNEALN